MTDLPSYVTIREVCLRDGLQLEDPIPLSAKLELLEAIVATGVQEIEATAFVSPSKVPALADAPRWPRRWRHFPASSSPHWWPAPAARAARSPRACGPWNTWCPPQTATARRTSGGRRPNPRR